jgi:type VI secretion system secreted protein Hcp
MADMFLALTDVNGESLDEIHPREIEIHDWSWSVSNNAPFGLHNVAEATKAGSAAHITIHKMFDAASVTLMNLCAHGQHIAKGKITCRKNAGDDKVEYLKIELTDIKIEQVLWLGKGQELSGLPEQVELSFLRFKVIYAMQIADGTLGGLNEFEFDIPQQKGQPAKHGK